MNGTLAPRPERYRIQRNFNPTRYVINRCRLGHTGIGFVSLLRCLKDLKHLQGAEATFREVE